MFRTWLLSTRICYSPNNHLLKTSSQISRCFASLPSNSVHQNFKIIGNVNTWVTVLFGWIAFGAYKYKNNQSVIAEKTDFSLMEYQYKISEYVEHKQFDEMIDFLWKELIRIANIGQGDADKIDFLESKLCGYLCKMGKAMDALKIVEPYSENELIQNQSLLRVAFVYHSAQKWKEAINLYKLTQDNMEQQLLNKVKRSDLPIIQKELNFICNMHMAHCYVGMKDIEKAKNIYSDLNIAEIIGYGADEEIFEFYKEFGTKDELNGFREFVETYKQKPRPPSTRKCPA